MALHGTTHSKAQKIRIEGFNKESNWFCPSPNQNYFLARKRRIEPSDLFNKAVGSVLWAGEFAIYKSKPSGYSDFPSIVIFASWKKEDHYFVYEDEHLDTAFTKRMDLSFKSVTYPSFGAGQASEIRNNPVAAIVAIESVEIQAIQNRASIFHLTINPNVAYEDAFERLLQDHFAAKTLGVIEELVLRGPKGGFIER